MHQKMKFKIDKLTKPKKWEKATTQLDMGKRHEELFHQKRHKDRRLGGSVG